jgi:WD40 repeat protein
LPCAVNLQSENIESCRLAFNSDCTQLAALGQSRHPSNVYVWDMTTGRLRAHFTTSYGDTKKSAITFHPEGRLIATGQNNGEIALWDLESGKVIRQLCGHGEGAVNSLQFSKDGTRLLSGGTDRTMRIWDWHLDKPLLTENEGWYVLSARFSPDGLSIANTGFYPVGAYVRKASSWNN